MTILNLKMEEVTALETQKKLTSVLRQVCNLFVICGEEGGEERVKGRACCLLLK